MQCKFFFLYAFFFVVVFFFNNCGLRKYVDSRTFFICFYIFIGKIEKLE